MKKVSIITVNFNQPDATRELLDSIIQTRQDNLAEVIVVDNGSRENHIPEWQAAYPNFTFLRSDENLGFAGGNNLGILNCKPETEYVFLVNNDTVVTPNLVHTLSDFLDANPGYAIVSPKIRYYDPAEMMQYAGFTEMNFYTARNRCVGQYETDNGQYDQLPALTHYPHGAAMMLRKTLVDKIGLMPEDYFLYYEEMDWCEMFKRAGYKTGLCMNALIYHKESLATGKNSKLKDYYMHRNRLLFVRRNAGQFQKLVFFLYSLTVLQMKYITKCISTGQAGRIPIFAKAVIWNIKNPAVSKSRKS